MGSSRMGSGPIAAEVYNGEAERQITSAATDCRQLPGPFG